VDRYNQCSSVSAGVRDVVTRSVSAEERFGLACSELAAVCEVGV
jgi:hypothetical protein